MPSRPHAVVVGLDCITGLQTARILARHGIPVLALAKNRKHFACRTRVCERVVYADTECEGFIEALAEIGPQLQERAVLFPCTDMTVLQISRHRDRLQLWYHVLLPEPDVVEMLMNKSTFYLYAQDEGLPIPQTRFVRNRADAEAAADTIAFPCVVKPALRTSHWDERARIKAYRVSGPGELLALYERVAGWTETLLVQEWVEGSEANLYSCNCYFDSASRPLVTFVARKLRQWPLETGTSSLGEECRNDVVLQETLRLFEDVRFRGLGYLEMKRNPTTGAHFIIEPNIGRPTGRSPIAEGGGVELLYAAYCDAVGLPLPDGLEQRYSGVKWIYWRADVQAAVLSWWRRETSLAEWWRSVRGKKTEAVFSRLDPLPFWIDVGQTTAKIARVGVAALVRRLSGARVW